MNPAVQGSPGDPGGHRRGLRRVAAWTTTGLAGLLVLFALIAPNDVNGLTPGAFLRIPLEGLLGVAVLLILPARRGWLVAARRVLAALAGVALGLLALWKIVDMGFHQVLGRPFDPVLDWTFLHAGAEFLADSMGRAAVTGIVAGAVVLAVTVLVVITLSMLRLTRILAQHRAVATPTVAVFVVAWVIVAVPGAQIVDGVPVAAYEYDRLLAVHESLRDQKAFAEEASVDTFRDTAGDQLLTALRGKDVAVVLVESYGRSAVEDPRYAPQIGAVLDAGTERLDAAGFAARSGYLTAPVAGGGSWLAQATLRSGLWINNQQRFRTLAGGDRMTLNRAFQRAGWRTVAVMPGMTRPWPESTFFGYDQIYTAQELDYQGPRLNWGTIPDQYALSAFQQLERAKAQRAPIMAEIPLLSSHAPWTPIPPLIDWEEIGDGSAYHDAVEMDDAADAWRDPPDVLRDPDQARILYQQAIEYSLTTVISYLETYGDDDLVLIILGDHQPSPLVTGEDATRDVPISIITGDPAVLERIAAWGWDDGLRPGPRAPVWRMDAFRDKFLTAFGTLADAGRGSGS